MCPEIPLWFILLATYGAMSLVGLPCWWAIKHLSELFIEKDAPVTYVGQISSRRKLFG